MDLTYLTQIEEMLEDLLLVHGFETVEKHLSDLLGMHGKNIGGRHWANWQQVYSALVRVNNRILRELE